MSFQAFLESFQEECDFIHPEHTTFDQLMLTAETQMLGSMPRLLPADLAHLHDLFSGAKAEARLRNDPPPRGDHPPNTPERDAGNEGE